ncbi:MAG: DNA gyrase inhibitor YacG, partial [Aestuariivirgaceae bacterium]
MSDKDASSQDAAKLVHLRPKRPCPICTKPSVHKYHPFCSARCADIDLHKWLGGQYAVPAVEQPDFE